MKFQQTQRLFFNQGKPKTNFLVYSIGIIVLSLLLVSCSENTGECYTRYSEYNKDSVIILDAFYKNEKRFGVQSSFYDDGTIKTMENYENGQVEGVYIDFYRNGDLALISETRSNRLEGERIEFYKGYRIKWQEQYSKGKRDGFSIHYDTLGNIIEKKYYEMGKAVPFPE